MRSEVSVSAPRQIPPSVSTLGSRLQPACENKRLRILWAFLLSCPFIDKYHGLSLRIRVGFLCGLLVLMLYQLIFKHELLKDKNCISFLD